MNDEWTQVGNNIDIKKYDDVFKGETDGSYYVLSINNNKAERSTFMCIRKAEAEKILAFINEQEAQHG